MKKEKVIKFLQAFFKQHRNQLITIGVASLLLGFFIGFEVRGYVIAKAISDVFNGNTITNTTTKNEAKTNVIEKNIGDEIQLATVKFAINSSSEMQTYNIEYGSPLIAKEGTKFVVVNADVSNITKASFYLSSGQFGTLIDNKDRIFNASSQFLSGKDISGDLAPDIKKNGEILFEIPNDAVSYSFVVLKGGTNDEYRVKLK